MCKNVIYVISAPHYKLDYNKCVDLHSTTGFPVFYLNILWKKANIKNNKQDVIQYHVFVKDLYLFRCFVHPVFNKKWSDPRNIIKWSVLQQMPAWYFRFPLICWVQLLPFLFLKNSTWITWVQDKLTFGTLRRVEKTMQKFLDVSCTDFIF